MDNVLFKAWGENKKRSTVIHIPYAKRKNKFGGFTYKTYTLISLDRWIIEKDSIEDQFIGPHASSMYSYLIPWKKVFDIIFSLQSK